MSVSQLRRAVLALGLGALVLPVSVHAQLREVVSKEVSVGRTEATLRLEFSDSGEIDITFEDGAVLVNGELVGSFEPGGDLEAAWRELLGDAVALDDGPLSEMLHDWTAPADLAGDLADVAREVDRALEEALEAVEISIDGARGEISISIGDQSSLIEALLGSVGRLGALEDALEGLEGLDADVRVHFNEDVVVGEGSLVEETLVLIGGSAEIGGEVDGDVVIVGGTLDLREGGRINGEARVADTRIVRNEGTVRGGIVDLLEEERDLEAELRGRLREEIRAEVRDDLRNELRSLAEGEDSFSIMAPFRPVFRAAGGIAENVVTVVILALLGALVLALAGDRVDVIADAAKRAPARSAMVGFAGTILLLPVWILGAVALAVSIIFIPVAIAWLPLFPLAACFAGLIGYLAVARNAGEWLADSEYPWTGWIRKSNPFVTMVGGLVGLMLAFVLAHLISILLFLDFLAAMLVFAGTLITIVAVQIGFGAVLVTRAGKRREWTPADPDEAWEAAMSVDVGTDDGGGTNGNGEAEEADDA